MSLAPVYALAAMHHDNSTDTSDIKFPIAKAKRVEGERMDVIEFHGDKDVRVAEVPRVTVTEPGDVVVHISSTTVCGSDLHLYHKEFLGLHKGDILGHEGMGIITEVGMSCAMRVRHPHCACTCSDGIMHRARTRLLLSALVHNLLASSRYSGKSKRGAMRV